MIQFLKSKQTSKIWGPIRLFVLFYNNWGRIQIWDCHSSFCLIFLLTLSSLVLHQQKSNFSAVCLHFDQLRWSFNYFCSMTRKYFPDAQTFLPQCILERIYKEKKSLLLLCFFSKKILIYTVCAVGVYF